MGHITFTPIYGHIAGRHIQSHLTDIMTTDAYRDTLQEVSKSS